MKKAYVSDRFVRLFHWSVVAIVLLNLTLLEEGRVHELVANWLIFSVLLHISGVVYERFRTNVNLISAMITGMEILQSDERDG